MAKRRRNKSLRAIRKNQSSGIIPRRTTRNLRSNRASGTFALDWDIPSNYQVIEVFSVAEAPSPTGRQRKRKTPVKKERSDQRLRVRCKERPKDNKPQGSGSGQKEFIPWC